MTIETREGDYLVRLYDNGTTERFYWPEGTVIVVPPKPVTEIQLKKALTRAERRGIVQYAQTDEEVADWLDLLQAAVRSGQPLLTTDQDLRDGFIRLRQLGVFTVERLQELQAQLLG